MARSRRKWPQVEARSERSTQRPVNEDEYAMAGNRVLLLDGITGDGKGDGLACSCFAAQKWQKCEDEGQSLDLESLSDDVSAFIDDRGIERSGASGVLADFDERGLVQIEGLGDTMACLIEPDGCSEFLLSPQRDDMRRLEHYLGDHSWGNVQSVTAHIAKGRSYLVLLTDGAWEYVPLSYMEDVCRRRRGNLYGIASDVLEFARLAGSTDDATVVVIG